MEDAQGQPGPAVPGGEEGTRLRCCPGLPAVPEENIQADRDVTAESNTAIYGAGGDEERGKQADGDENKDGRNGPWRTAEVWTGAAAPLLRQCTNCSSTRWLRTERQDVFYLYGLHMHPRERCDACVLAPPLS